MTAMGVIAVGVAGNARRPAAVGGRPLPVAVTTLRVRMTAVTVSATTTTAGAPEALMIATER